MNRRTVFIITGIIVAAALTAAGHFLHQTIVNAWNHKQLQELAERTLLRADVAIDLAVIEIGNLIEAGKTNCSTETIAALRQAVFAVGSLKDVHLLLPGERCHALLDLAADVGDRSAAFSRYPARNPAIMLTPIIEERWAGLGVAWRFEDESEFFAVMSTDSLVFDMLPAHFREDAYVVLSLNGTPVATYEPSEWGEAGPRSSTTFSAGSSRYPITARIGVDAGTLAAWNKDLRFEVVAMFLVFAVTSGLVTARGFVGPAHPAAELDRAIASGELIPYFQPIVSLSGQRITGCEMLARWVRTDGTSVPPQHFIGLAEMWGRADRLTEALLTEAGRTLGPALAARPDFKLSINVTPGQFLSDGFAERLSQLAEAAGLPQDRLVVELTERQEIKSIETAASVTAALNLSGIQVAVDDTGAGHNGLSVIKALGASCMKIDKVFIDGLETDARARTVVEMLVNIARDFRMTPVAEGVERTEQVATLLSLGVPEGQGFLFSPAVPADEFLSLLKAGFVRERAETGRAETSALRKAGGRAA